MKWARRLTVPVIGFVVLAVLSVQANLSLLGGGYVALPNGALFDWASFVPASVVWMIEEKNAPAPCHVVIQDPEDHATLTVDRCA